MTLPKPPTIPKIEALQGPVPERWGSPGHGDYWEFYVAGICRHDSIPVWERGGWIVWQHGDSSEARLAMPKRSTEPQRYRMLKAWVEQVHAYESGELR